MVLKALLFSIYHFEVTNIMKMMILKDAMGMFKDSLFVKNNFTWVIIRILTLKLEYLEIMFDSILY
jgi:hypothetical protein